MTTNCTRLIFVNLPVRDLKRSMAFFGQLGFTQNEICNTTKQTEGLFALSCSSRAEVDELVEKAVAAGGKHAMAPQDHGVMYGWSFYDPDGHHWEVMWMDPKTIQPQ